MQKRPTGITILAIWAMAASGFAFFNAFYHYLIFDFFGRPEGIPVEVWYDLNLISAISSLGGFVSAPLGSWIAGFLLYDPANEATFAPAMTLFISLGVLYALISRLTFRGSRLGWLGNVGVSIIAAIALPISFINFYSLSQANIDSISESWGIQLYFAWWSFLYLVYSTGVGLRLYYLFRPSVRDFFGTKSLFVQKQTA